MKKLKIIFSLLLVFVFTAILAAYNVDSLGKVIECTACKDGVRSLGYNAVNYDVHFIISLAIALMPLLWVFIKNNCTQSTNT